MAQLVERSLPTPKICSSNPVIGNLVIGNQEMAKTMTKRVVSTYLKSTQLLLLNMESLASVNRKMCLIYLIIVSRKVVKTKLNLTLRYDHFKIE